MTLCPPTDFKKATDLDAYNDPKIPAVYYLAVKAITATADGEVCYYQVDREALKRLADQIAQLG
jgi:hypothetical protein